MYAGGDGGEAILIMVVGHDHSCSPPFTLWPWIVHSRITMQPAHPATAVASPESLGGVYTNYSKWVRYENDIRWPLLVDGRRGVELDLLRSSLFLGNALPAARLTPICAKASSDTSHTSRYSEPI